MIELLKSIPETDALDVLRRLKSGGDVQQVLDQTREGNLLMQLSSSQRRDGRYALPFIADLPEASAAQETESPESSRGTRRESESVASTASTAGTDLQTMSGFGRTEQNCPG